MPIELSLDCILEGSAAWLEGDLTLLVVGNCPALGDGRLADGVPLLPLSEEASPASALVPRRSQEELRQTGGAGGGPRPRRLSRRCFRLAAPLFLAEGGAALPRLLEYHYVAYDAEGNKVWEEDFGHDEDPLPRFGSDFDCAVGQGAVASSCQDRMKHSRPRRKLMRQVLTPRCHCLLWRVDAVYVPDIAMTAADSSSAQYPLCWQFAWNITPSWNPSLADGDAEVGPSLEALGTVVQKLPFDVGTVEQLFVKPRRSLLLTGLRQLTRQRRLNREVWLHIAELTGLMIRESPRHCRC